MASSSLPPRLSNRLLLSLYGEQRVDDVAFLRVQRKKLLTEIDNADVTKPLKVDAFLNSAMPPDVAQKVRRQYMTFIKEVSVVEAGNNHPNAAKTMYSIITRARGAKEEAHREAVSYFGPFGATQFDSIWLLAEELQSYAESNEAVTQRMAEFGSEISFASPDVSSAPDLSVFSSVLDRLCSSEPVGFKEMGSSANPAPAAPSLTPAQTQRKESRAWLLQLCEAHVSANPGAPFEALQLANSLISACDQAKAAEEAGRDGEGVLQAALFELVGEGGFDLMLEVIQQRRRISGLGSADALEKPVQSAHAPVIANSSSSGHQISRPAHTAEILTAEDKALIEALAAADMDEDMHFGGEERDQHLSANQRRKRELKQARALERAIQETAEGSAAGSGDWLQQLGFDDAYLMEERALGLQKGRSLQAIPDNWLSNLAPEGSTQVHERRGLPAGTERTVRADHEEVAIPAAARPAPPAEGELVEVAAALEPWAQKAFAGTKFLNTIQSRVFPCAYHSFENMLVCAPTGAGKTNVAMLTLLQLVGQHRDAATGRIDMESVKAVYIAPMKALAQEVVAKFAERLGPLGLVVREFTGDMQLTKQEVAEAQLLVCTPEKYDVVTRKGGDKSLGTLVQLLIIDEVHLLADERGAVIETIVARTQRYVESSQKLVRIVGLSATLPNYQDVASFLRVNSRTGLHYFGPEFRPIPLAQTFLGVTEKQRVKRNDVMNRLAYEKMVEALKRGKQVMVFVHARKETVKTAEALAELSGRHGSTDLLQNHQHERFSLFQRQVDRSRSRELQQLFAKGLGVHHAGMLRADRTLTEQLFEAGLIKVLCCTATLAWGINLPAHTVIIKGTELYDPERGGFVDLSILDVLQIFGRAGRPQYDTTGHAVMITPHRSLSTYLGMLTNQAPIESSLIKALPDHLNAEIVNGTVNNIKEAASWLSYTFLFVRMCRNPLVYGLAHEDLFADPRLEQKRVQLVREAADTLDSCMMCRYDKRSGNLAVTNLGRIASHYYIRHGTVEAFNTMLAPHLSTPDALHVLCSSAEFDQLKVRPEELPELDTLRKSATVSVRSTTDDTAGKVNVLLQGYLSKAPVGSFTLQSDTNYVAQNAGRITRALFEICLKRGWSTMANHYLGLCKAIDRRMLPSQSPLRQFSELPAEVLKRLEDTGSTPDRLLDLTAREVGQLVHNQKMGARVLELAGQLPHLAVDTFIQPITRGILRLVLTLRVDFKWADRYHGAAEAFWVWIEDSESEYVYHAEHVIISKREAGQTKELEVTIPVREPLPPQYYVRVVSDTWVGCESVFPISFQHLVLPSLAPTHTDLLPVHPVPRSALKNPSFEALFPFSHFNPIQSQMFHTLYHSDRNVLVGAPTGSGKTITGELALLRLLNQSPGAKCVYVAPLKALARERLQDWQSKFGGRKNGPKLRILELTGDVNPSVDELNSADLLIVTPEKWDSISRGWQRRQYVQRVELVIIDEVHLLGVDRGPVLEVIVSRMRFVSTQTARPIRFVALSTALANPRDLGDWLGIGEVGVYNFRSAVRPVPLTTHIQGFPGQHYCPRMATMNKPAYAAILEHSPHKPALVFVASRRQTRLTALDLIAYCAADDNPKQFLHMPEDEVEAIAATLQDAALRDTIVFGVALHHAGLHPNDRKTVEELFTAGKVQVLVCTSTLAWGVNLPCHLVIVKGTEFFDAKLCRYVDMPVTDVLQMMGRAGRPQFDATGTACIFVHEPKKTFYKKFLHEPFPVESSLHLQLHDHLNAEVAMGALHTVRDCIDFLSWTYYFRRLLANPAYYGLVQGHGEGAGLSAEAVEGHLVQLVAQVAADLCAAGCIEVEAADGDLAVALSANTHFSCTYLGRIASLYYLSYKTVGFVRSRLLAIDNADASQAARAGAVSRLDARTQLWEVLLLLCEVPEFAELPVRHCEDELNEQLAKDITRAQGDKADSPRSLFTFLSQRSTFDSPHCKAFLLLVARMEAIALPISDYTTDTKTVLDQTARVLRAMVDIAAEEELLDLVLRLLTLSQLLVQGLSLGGSELSQLPGVSGANLPKVFKDRRIHSLRDLLLLSPEQMRQVAAKALEASTSDGADAGGSRRGGRQRFNNSTSGSARSNGEYEASTKIAKFLEVCASLPLVSVSSVTFAAREEGGESAPLAQIVAGSLATSAPLFELRPGRTYVATVQLQVRGGGGRGERGSAVFSKHPHKTKQATWYLTAALLHSPQNASATALANVHYTDIVQAGSIATGGDLLVLKQIGAIKAETATVEATFEVPAEEGEWPADLALSLVCDSMQGLDCTVRVPVQIVPTL